MINSSVTESSTVFEAISQAAQDAIIVINNRGKIIYWNPSAERIFGYTEKEAKGQDVHKLLAPDEYSYRYNKGFTAFQCHGQGAAIGKTLEFTARKKDESVINIELSVSAIYMHNEWQAIAIIRDITDRKTIEHNLLEIKYQLRAILDNIPDIVWLKDGEGRFIAGNEALANACGVPLSEVFGKTDLDFFPDPVAKHFQENDQEVITDASKKIIEESIITANGDKRVIETFKTPVCDENGKVVGTAGIAHDITIRKKMELDLKVSELRFRELFENINSNITILKPNNDNTSFLLEDLNHNCEKFIKIKKENIKGKDFFEFFPPLKKSIVYSAVLNVCRTGKPYSLGTFYYEGVNVKGWLSGNVYKLSSGEIGLVIDNVTDKKEAESKLLLTQFTVDHSSVEVFWISSDGRIYRVNSAVSDTLGYTEYELLSKKIWEINPNYTPKKWYDIFQHIKQNKIYQYQSTHCKKNGNVIPVEITANYLEYEGVEYNIAYVVDITERKKVEKELAQKRSDLERMVEIKTKELKKSLTELEHLNEVLKDANNHKNKFLSSMSHELRTPLNAVLGFSNALKLQYYGPLNDKQEEYVKLINESGSHLLSLINDVLDISKIDSGVTDLNFETLDVVKITEDVISLMRHDFIEKEISFDFFKPAEPVIIKVDSCKYKQILLNYISNALKFTERKGSVIVVLDNTDENYIKVKVKDTGTGICKKDQQKVFEEFYQADSVRKKAIGGAGIGLALTKRLVKMHEGEVGLISELDKGSEFWFTMPKEHLINN